MIDMDDHRLAMAKEMGATHTINSGKEDAIAKVMELTGQRGVDCAIEAVGVEPTWNTCQSIVKEGGHLANVGVHGKAVKFSIEKLWIKNPPIGKAKQYPDLQLTALIATEESSDNETRIEWKLLTDLPVANLAEATEKLEWYSHRWKIETFHKVMKSGCQAERSRLGSAERLTNLLCCYCILSWRIFWLTMLSREIPNAPVELAFNNTEIKILDTMIKDTAQVMSSPPLEKYTIKLAQLGGYTGNKNKHPPGNIVIWRGLRRLNEIQIGWELATERCG
jgi:hypothetical protein